MRRVGRSTKARKVAASTKVPIAERRATTPNLAPSTKAAEPVAHVLIRVRSENGLTVSAHANIVASKGAAIVGKIGGPIGMPFREMLNRQIDSGVKTYLFMTTREGWNGPYVTYRCPLRRVHQSLDISRKDLVPNYYVGEASKINTWFEISGIDRMTRDEMNKIFVLSSKRSIMSVINSSAVVFRVGVGE